MDLPLVVIEPTAPHTHTVVFLHGRGDSASNFSAALCYWSGTDSNSLIDAFPSFRWVLPQAPRLECTGIPGAVMQQWFDTWSSKNYSLREEVQLPGLKETVPALRTLLAKEAEKLSGKDGPNAGDGWNRLILAGISMGGATSIHTLINLHIPTQSRRLGALMTFSSRCPYVDREHEGILDLEGIRALLDGLPDVPDHADVIRNTPILMEHCIDDNMVPISRGRAARDELVRFGGKVEWKEYPTGGHWFHSPTGLDDTIAFLRKHVLS